MALAHSTSDLNAQDVAAGPVPLNKGLSPIQSRLTRLLEHAIFVFLLLFVIALPHSIKGAERTWKIALVLWLLKLAIGHLRPLRQPLAAPLLAYVTLSAISTILSPDPFLSWDRMKFVCLFLVGIVVAQNLKRLSQVRWLVAFLVFSGLSAAVYTGWEYTYGVGVRLVQFSSTSRLSQVGLEPGDIIISVNGNRIHAPEQLVRLTGTIPLDARVTVDFLHGMNVRASTVTATGRDLAQLGLDAASVKLARGRPLRAQGTLGHYVVFAEMLMQIGCMAWALMLATARSKLGWKLAFAVAFAGITAALFATETRAAVIGLLLGCLLSLLLLTVRMTRIVAITAIVAILAGAMFWLQHARQVGWVDRQDAGTHFRVLMWEDGVRLVRAHPWFGVGMETVRVHFREWNIRGFIQYKVQSHFHSTFLQIAVERGLPALVAWLWFCIAYLVLLVRLIPKLRAQSRIALGVAAGILAGFVAFTFTSFFHYDLGEESVAMILFLYFGLAVALERMAAVPGSMDVR